VARRAGKRLIIAGKVDDADRAYFTNVVAPLIDGDRVKFVGEADARMKRELYAEAQAVLMPIQWEEPFGLVLAEAQACGTPVITFHRGAAPEIVRHEESGFVVWTLDEMVDAVRRVREIDPAACRENVERRFDAPIMANNYVSVYERMLEHRGRQHVAQTSGHNGQRPNGLKETTQVA
jgi:glycosyltransferase involved in cell wall biosynthesis